MSNRHLMLTGDVEPEVYSCESVIYRCCSNPETYNRLFREIRVEKSIAFKTKPEVLE